MIGVVLCGGQSIRMGQDKGLIPSESGEVWAEVIRQKFSSLMFRSILSINPMQKERYLEFFEENSLIIDSATISVRGPLLGVLSVHLKYPDQDLMVVACDLINLDSAVLIKLFDSFNSSQTEATAFKGEQIEPLCAIYSSRGLAKILNASQAGKLRKHSIIHVLEELSAKYIPIPEEWKSYFKNFNSTEELN